MKRVRRVIAWMMFVGGLIGWPLSALTFAKQEPQAVLGLSWVAIILEGFNALQIAHDSDSE